MLFELYDTLGVVMLVVNFAIIVVAIYAFVMSLMYPAAAYDAAGKWTKQGWTIVLGIGVLTTIIPTGLPLIGIAFLVAALVFIVDVRPALVGLRRR